MAELKTQPSATSVAAFLDAVEPPQRQADGRTVCHLLQRITGEEPRMWGPSIVGFGSYSYTYDSGRSGTMCRLGFSPRKANLVLYVLSGRDGEADKLARLGKHKTGASCLYINKLADIDLAVLEAIARDSLAEMNRRYPPA
ncbi:DUF1801 domain-containing protein [Sphingomonas turrisvirgatae]|uniref:YdhG-like domain-containing protein n=1 Tax=Sphingomonas turrisvirgatae TaxID=1888892 RepID=A0A1E3M0T7_9SPHN|nr:DUF1801 domain-containing protein [Sphingomonas turrisvirgatae]ODP39644.1 hypothetical protein BFL28_08370 [Sphingomonas turrisvirgatae]